MSMSKSPSWFRRYAHWLLTGVLCVLKIAGAGIPLWVCLAPALLPIACALALITSALALFLFFVIAYIVLLIYGAVTGAEYVS